MDPANMAQYHNKLRNARLHEGPLPSAEYNQLPHINTMRGVAAKNAQAHAHLLGLIASHNLSEIFSIHLIHKHFNIAEEHVMVYETICGATQQPFIVSCPRKIGSCDARGLYFIASGDGSMHAYEYTTDPGADLGDHTDFVANFSKAVIDLGVEKVFALTAKKINQEVMTEFELGDLSSTVLVTDVSWLPDATDPEQSTTTDWTADADYVQYASRDGSVPGVIQLKCTKTRSTNHYNVTCSQTRSGAHYEQKPAFRPGIAASADENATSTATEWNAITGAPQNAVSTQHKCNAGRFNTHNVVDSVVSDCPTEHSAPDSITMDLYLGENLLPRESKGFSIISHAMQLIASY